MRVIYLEEEDLDSILFNRLFHKIRDRLNVAVSNCSHREAIHYMELESWFMSWWHRIGY